MLLLFKKKLLKCVVLFYILILIWTPVLLNFEFICKRIEAEISCIHLNLSSFNTEKLEFFVYLDLIHLHIQT